MISHQTHDEEKGDWHLRGGLLYGAGLIWLCLHFICQHWWKRFWFTRLIVTSAANPLRWKIHAFHIPISINRRNCLIKMCGEIIFSLLIEPDVDKTSAMNTDGENIQMLHICLDESEFFRLYSCNHTHHINKLFHISFFNVTPHIISHLFKGIWPAGLSISVPVLYQSFWSLNTTYDVVCKSFKTD